MPSAWGDFKDRTRRFWADVGLTEWQKAVRDAVHDGRPIPPSPPEEHHYRTCRDEDCPEEPCRAYKEGLEDGRDY